MATATTLTEHRACAQDAGSSAHAQAARTRPGDDDVRAQAGGTPQRTATGRPGGRHDPADLRLGDLPGVGPRLEKAILVRFRSAARFVAALHAADLHALCEVEGISERRAVDLVRHVRGGATDAGFLGTPAARRIHQDILARIQSHAATRHGRDRLRLLDLLADPQAAQERMRHVLAMKEEVEGSDRQRVHALLRRLRPLQDPEPRCDTGLQVIAGSHDILDSLRERGIGRHAMLATPDEIDPDAELVVLVHEGGLDAAGLEQAVEADADAPLADIVPGSVLHWVEHNRRVLEACRDLADLRGTTSHAPAVLDAADEVVAATMDEAAIRAAVEEVRAEADQAVQQQTQGLSLSGSELLAAIGSGRLPPTVEQVVRQALQDARTSLRARTGLSFQPLLPGLPVQVDEEELARTLHGLRSRGRIDQHEQARRAARTITPLREPLAKEVAAWLEYDADVALGSFASAHGLQAWDCGQDLRIDDGLHLALADAPQPQAVSYRIGGDARVALLTGANSGGKSTLLELVAQALTLARLGLPAPGRCTLPWLDELHVVRARQGMDAGAFETFLRAFMPACRGDARRMVLADEVESMTELEAAGRILGHFVGRLATTQSLGIVVTHMAKHVLEHVPEGAVRVDGIEATGLDEDDRLVVDRQPKMGRLARSTPELIVERLARTAGDDAPLYEELLASLRHPETRK